MFSDPGNQTITADVAQYARRNESLFKQNNGKPMHTVQTWKAQRGHGMAYLDTYSALCRGESLSVVYNQIHI